MSRAEQLERARDSLKTHLRAYQVTDSPSEFIQKLEDFIDAYIEQKESRRGE